MDCGANEFLCQFLDFVTTNAEHLRDLPKIIDASWQDATGEKGWAVVFLKEHGEKIFAGGSLLFALWKWWLYNERVLHKRLEEYIDTSDEHIEPASAKLTEALLRPSTASPLPRPAFALEFQDILKRTRFARTFGVIGLETAANWKLGKNLRGIQQRMKTAQNASHSLQKQQIHLLLIAGALLSAKARYSRDKAYATKCTRRALRQFRKVLSIPGYHRNVVAKENEALQLLRLGELEQSQVAFEKLEEYSSDISDTRKRDLIVARGKQHRAAIRAQQTVGQPLGAWNLIKPRERSSDQIGALGLRERYIGSYKDWDAIEQAELHYFAAYIAHRCNFNQHEPQQLKEAEDTYTSVLEQLPTLWFLRADSRRLRQEARDGRRRVRAAPNYDTNWLRVA